MLLRCAKARDVRSGECARVGEDQDLSAGDDLERPRVEQTPCRNGQGSLFEYFAYDALLRRLALLELTARQFPLVSLVQSQENAALVVNHTLHRNSPTHPSTITRSAGDCRRGATRPDIAAVGCGH